MSNNVSRKNKILSLLVQSSLALAISPVIAQQDDNLVLEEILVTAQLRQEPLQDVPVSVAAVEGEKLYESGISKIEDLQAFVPNLTMSETGIGTNIYIRGIGSGINQGFEQSTGMYVDGVSYGRAQLSRAPFLDLERVEVLRGPQNILYGKNSIAGAISMITAKPTEVFEGSVSASLSLENDEDEEVIDLVLSGPITDNISARFAARQRDKEGFIENLTSGDAEPERDETTMRLQVQFDVTDNFDVNVKIENSEFEVEGRQVEIVGETKSQNAALIGDNTWSEYLTGGSPFWGLLASADDSVLNTDIDGKRSSNGDFSNNEIDNITITANYNWNDYLITATIAQVEYEYDELCDCDFTGADLFFVESSEEYEQDSFEFRIASPTGQAFEWIAGMYYQESDLDFNDAFFTTPDTIVQYPINTGLFGQFAQLEAANTLPAGFLYPGTFPLSGPADSLVNISVPREFTQESELTSIFGQVTWNVSDVMRLTLGARYTDEEKEGSRSIDYEQDGASIPVDTSFIPAGALPPGSMGIDYLLASALYVTRHDIEDKYDEDNIAPLINIEYDLNEDVMLYGTWTKGFKSGGFDARSNLPPSVTTLGAGLLEVSRGPGSFQYDEETAVNLELGAKMLFNGGQGELNIAAFMTEYEDLQVSIYDGVLGFNVGNAAEATTTGIEIDGRYRLTENFTVLGSIAFLDFEFDDFDGGQCTQAVRIERTLDGDPATDPNAPCDAKGDTNQYVADYSGNLTLDYTSSLSGGVELNSALDFVFTDDYNPSQNVDKAIEQDGYTKINWRLSLGEPQKWEVALLVRNITDEEIITYANDVPLAANLSQTTGYYAFVEEGKTTTLQGKLWF